MTIECRHAQENGTWATVVCFRSMLEEWCRLRCVVFVRGWPTKMYDSYFHASAKNEQYRIFCATKRRLLDSFNIFILRGKFNPLLLTCSGRRGVFLHLVSTLVLFSHIHDFHGIPHLSSVVTRSKINRSLDHGVVRPPSTLALHLWCKPRVRRNPDILRSRRPFRP